MSDPRDAWLAAALRAGSGDRHPREDCPAPERIWSAVRLELPLDERLAIVDHVTECGACAEAWRLAREMGSQNVEPAAHTSAARLAARFRRLPLAAAAAIVVGIGLLFAVRGLWLPEDAEVRDPATAVLRSEVGDVAVLPREDFRLRWSGGPPAARYDLTVTTSDLDVVVDERALERQEYRVDPARLARFASGTRLLWRVVARAPDGVTASSPTFEVSVR